MNWEELIKEVAKEYNLYLIQTKLSGSEKNPSLKVVVDTDQGITIDEITQITKKLKKSKRMNILFPSGFRLMVTSPGLDYPLTKEYQFLRNIDRRVMIKHNNPELPNPIEGILREFKGGILMIEKGNSIHGVHFTDVIEGKLILTY